MLWCILIQNHFGGATDHTRERWLQLKIKNMKTSIMGFLITISLLSSNCEKGKNNLSDDILKAGYIPDSYSIHNQYGPDTIFLGDKNYDFNNDQKSDLKFHSQYYEYVDPSDGRSGYYCNSSVTITDTAMSAAIQRNNGSNYSIIHYGDKLDDLLAWNQEMTGLDFLFNKIMSTRGVEDRFYWDSTGYIGIKYGERLGWIKIKVNGCNEIILYECLIN